jgi:hypothetical protein
LSDAAQRRRIEPSNPVIGESRIIGGEPHAPPGGILVTGQFVDAWRDLLGAGGMCARPVGPHEVPLLRESDGRFDLAKPGGEAPMLRRLRVLDGPASLG